MIRMENDNVGSRVRRIAASTAGFLTAAALVTATVYPSTTFSGGTILTPYAVYASAKEKSDNYFYTIGRLTGKMELTCIPNTKMYDSGLCYGYIEELLNFLSGKNPTSEIEDKMPKPVPNADKKYTCPSCHVE